MKITVTGSLGNISKPLTKELLQNGHSVTVISSKPEKQKDIEALGATAAIGSIDDVTFLARTFAGSDAVYCMIPPNFHLDHNLDTIEYCRTISGNYAQAIQQAGVKRVVHLSSIGAHLDKDSGLILAHHYAENILKEIPGIAITHLRPTAFYYNLFGFVGRIKSEGVMASNYGAEDRVPWVSPIDIAAAVAEELVTPLKGRKVRYVASEEPTCSEVASILGAAIGKPDLKWVILSNEETQNGLEAAGIPSRVAAGLVEMNASIHSGVLSEDYYRNRPTALGKVKLTDFAKEFAAAFK
ncbi:MAG TPA: NAD(P)H-binding protein [Chryseolinea sp.]